MQGLVGQNKEFRFYSKYCRKPLKHFILCIYVFIYFYIFWTQVPYQIFDVQIFSPILWVVFSFSLCFGCAPRLAGS